jgi:hypothetical protein
MLLLNNDATQYATFFMYLLIHLLFDGASLMFGLGFAPLQFGIPFLLCANVGKRA